MKPDDPHASAEPTLQSVVAWLTEEAAIASTFSAPEDDPNRRLMLTLREVSALTAALAREQEANERAAELEQTIADLRAQLAAQAENSPRSGAA